MPSSFMYCNAYLSVSFKARVAASVGIHLEEMRGYGGEKPWPFASSEPLVILLAPNEPLCLKISPADCIRIADRLEPIVRSWECALARQANSQLRSSRSGRPHWVLPYDHEISNAREACRGLRKAAELNEPMTFG